jgi:hypothetical protein
MVFQERFTSLCVGLLFFFVSLGNDRIYGIRFKYIFKTLVAYLLYLNMERCAFADLFHLQNGEGARRLACSTKRGLCCKDK